MTAPAGWPLLDYAISWASGPSQSPVQPYWCSLSARTEGTTSVRRGKQYELDQVQPGEMTLTLRNDDGAFDPANSGSPFWPRVIPYRLIRLRAQYPATINLLTADQATAWYDSKGSGGAGSTLPPNVFSLSGSALAVGYSATLGTNYYAVTVPANTQYATVAIGGWSVQPGATYSAQCMADVNGGLTAQIALRWVDVNGNTISSVGGSTTTSTTGALVTVTGTAPANAAGAVVYVQNTTTSASSANIAGWLFQVEQNSAASAYVQPSPWYSLFTGYVERWPQAWSSGGNYGTVALNCVDLFGFLANTPLLDPFAADLLALNPNFLYELNEQSGTKVFQDLTRKRGPAIIDPTVLANSLVAGQSLTSGDNAPPGQARPSVPLTGAFLGGAGPVVQSALPLAANGAPYTGGGALLIPPDPASGKVGPPQSGYWTRIIAARATGVPPAQRDAFMWQYVPKQNAGDFSGVSFYVANTNMETAVWSQGASVGYGGSFLMPAIANPSTAVMSDTDWHLYAICYEVGTNNLWLFNDDQTQNLSNKFNGNINPPQGTPASGAADCVAASATSYTTGENWIGDLAFVCEIPAQMTTAQWLALYASWRNAWASGSDNGAVETSGNRYQRILNWIGYAGPTRIDGGASVDYGPASDIQGGNNPTYALQALQNVVATEYGQHFIAADGTIVFQARTERYNPTSVASFGEHAGEIPYTGAKMDFDPTRVANAIEVDAQYGNAPYFASDSTSQNNYGQIGLQWTANSLDPNELQDGAEYLLYQNKQPLQRLEALPVDVGANPGLWGSLLPLDLGAAVTVNRRPSAAPAMSQVGFLEQMQWSISDRRAVTWSAQVSNAANHYFATLDSPILGRLGADGGNTLNAAIGTTDTTLAIASTTAVFTTASSDYPLTITIGSEQITFPSPPSGSTSPQTFTGITRGANSTTPAAHPAGATVSVVGSIVLGF